MDQPRTDNRTEFIVQPLLLVGKEGERLVVVVKATFLALRGGGPLELASKKERRKVRAADFPWGNPEKSSIKYPADLCLLKPGTDVIVVAAAHAPEGKPVPFFDAGVRVGPLQKAIRIFGLRVWEANGNGLSAPRPTKGMEVRYDYAWGGIDLTDMTRIVEEPRNPVGMGIARDLSTLTHQPAPFIEDPANLISSVRTRPPPAGIGAIGRHWLPRRPLFGTYDGKWISDRAPLLPLDYDDRATLCASPGLTATPPLRGGEDVALLNLRPGGGTLGFRLPKLEVTVTLEAPKRDPEPLHPHLDTVVIDTLAVPEEATAVVELVWRGIFRPPRRLKDAHVVVSEKELS